MVYLAWMSHGAYVQGVNCELDGIWDQGVSPRDNSQCSSSTSSSSSSTTARKGLIAWVHV